MIPRWHLLRDNCPAPKVGPFVSSMRLLDIPNTLIGAITSMPANCVALCIRADPLNLKVRDIGRLEGAARRRGMRIFWVKRRIGKI